MRTEPRSGDDDGPGPDVRAVLPRRSASRSAEHDATVRAPPDSPDAIVVRSPRPRRRDMRSERPRGPGSHRSGRSCRCLRRRGRPIVGCRRRHKGPGILVEASAQDRRQPGKLPAWLPEVDPAHDQLVDPILGAGRSRPFAAGDAPPPRSPGFCAPARSGVRGPGWRAVGARPAGPIPVARPRGRAPREASHQRSAATSSGRSDSDSA